MSLPPTTVKIKRKRTDEPVDFLRVHEANGKRQRRATDFVFSRQATPEPSIEPVASPATQSLRKIKPLHRSASTQALSTPTYQPISQSTLSQTHNVTDSGVINQDTSGQSGQSSTQCVTTNGPLDNGAPQTQVSEFRRFHISRASTPNTAGFENNGQGRKRKDQPTVFIERRLRPKSADGKKLAATSQSSTIGLAERPTRPQKKPGLNARSPVPRSRETSPPKPSPLVPLPERARLPSGLVNRWDVSSDELAAQMQAYTLQEIGYNLAQAEASKPAARDPPSPVSVKKIPSKFKPKKPALRYAERHPEEMQIDATSMDVDHDYTDEDIDSDGDYIIDTYIRMPAEALEVSEMQKNIGLLVLDSQPDIDEFYREDEDSDEEEDDEDEDENAENHYTADYPDEEVDSDDEYGRNAYNYRTHNASDLEEFDENDATYSDDDNDSTMYPWTKKPWMARPDDVPNNSY